MSGDRTRDDFGVGLSGRDRQGGLEITEAIETRVDWRGDLVRRVGVWALWGTTAAPLLFSSRTIYPYVVPRAVYFRMLVAIAAWVAATRFFTQRSADDAGSRRDPLLIALSLFVGIQLAAALLGAAPERSLFGDLQRMEGVIAWVHYLAFYVALGALLTDGEFFLLLRLAMLVSMVVGAVAVLQAAGVAVGILPTGEGRIVGTLGNAGFLAAYGLLGIATASIVALRSHGVVWKAAAGAAAALSGLALTVAFTRTALIGLGVGVPVALIVSTVASEGRRRSRSYAAIGVLIVLTGLGAWTLMTRAAGDSPAGRLLDVADVERGLGNRVSAWRAGVRAIGDHPMTGLGPENFRLAFDWHFDPDRLPAEAHFNRAHNELLEAAVAGGVPGGLAWLAIWLALLYSLLGAWRGGRLGSGEVGILAGAFTAYLVYLLAWFRDPNSFVVFLLLAAFVGSRRSRAADAGGGADPGRKRITVTGGALIVTVTLVVAVDIAYHARVFSAGRHLVSAVQERRVVDTTAEYEAALDLRVPGAEEVVTEFVRFSSALPGAVGDQLQRPEARNLVLDVLERARAALAAHLVRDPRNPRLHRDAGQLHVVRFQTSGDSAFADSAAASFQRAIELAPGRLRYRYMLSEVRLMADRPAAAVEAAAQGVRLHDGFGESHYYLAKALVVEGSFPEAADALARAYELDYVNPSGAVHDVLERELRDSGRMDLVVRLQEARGDALADR